MSNVLCKDTVVVWWNEGETEPTDGAPSISESITVMQQQLSGTTSGAYPALPTDVAVRQGTVAHSYNPPASARSITFACQGNTGVFDPWTLVLGFSDDTRATKIKAKVREGNFGKPLYVFDNGTYLAVWSGDNGIGLYVFSGYSVVDYPTQTIELTLSNTVITF
jgi:hypothetical protein